MGSSGRRLAASLAAVYALAGAGSALGAVRTPGPIVSAPSEYVEVIPTAGGGVPERPHPHRFSPASVPAPGSALGAAADAVSSADRFGAIGLAGAMIVTAVFLLAAARRRRRSA
jgi:hypothetical protein